MDTLKKIVKEIPPKAKILAEKYWPGPLTMILQKAEIVPPETTGGLDNVAVSFPSDRIAQELIRRQEDMWLRQVPTLPEDRVQLQLSMKEERI